MELTEKIKNEIKSYALSDQANETCGLITELEVIPCKNRASDSNVHFIITAADIKKAGKRGKLIGVYHSHIANGFNYDYLSKEDIVVSEHLKITSVLYSIIEDKFYIYKPTGKPIEYEGRPYAKGTIDEFVLIKDYYKRELNIEIQGLKDRNIETFLQKNGFVMVGEINKHDILIIKRPNKLNKEPVIYIGDNKILIHKEFESSKITEYNYGIKNWTERIYRYYRM